MHRGALSQAHANTIDHIADVAYLDCDPCEAAVKERKAKYEASWRSLCTQKQPETAALKAAFRKGEPMGAAVIAYLLSQQVRPQSMTHSAAGHANSCIHAASFSKGG